MKIFIATDIALRIYKNHIYTINKCSTIFRRYYNAFGKIVFCCRVDHVEEITDNCDDITEITDKIIPADSLMKGLVGQYDKRIKEAMKDCDLVICRCPSIYAYRAADCAKSLNKPYFTESMGCAWDAYWNHGIDGKIIAPYMFLKMKQVVKDADYASYVTSEFLQKRYPTNANSLSASNVFIKQTDDSILNQRINHIKNSDNGKLTLVTTAAVDVKYKGQQYVIRAIPILKKHGVNCKYIIIGGGDQSYLKNLAERIGVSENIVFTGTLTQEEIFEQIDNSDIYIQPSLQEGLPRAVIEAMSRACPCLGARTAGIPELIDEECVFKRKSVNDIVDKILAINKENSLENFAKNNYIKSKQYYSDVLDKRRNNYYSKIIEKIYYQKGVLNFQENSSI